MSIEKMLLREKRLEVLKKCNMDIRDVKNYLFHHYNLPKGTDWTKEKHKFEALLNEETEDVAKSNRIMEFIRKFGVKLNDN